MIKWSETKSGFTGTRNGQDIAQISMFARYSVIWRLEVDKDRINAFSSADDAKQYAEKTLANWVEKMGWKEDSA